MVYELLLVYEWYKGVRKLFFKYMILVYWSNPGNPSLFNFTDPFCVFLSHEDSFAIMEKWRQK